MAPSVAAQNVSYFPTTCPPRIRRPPPHFKDYICPTISSSTHQDMALLSTLDQEPKSLKNALKSPHWFSAMQEELTALYSNNTWRLVPHPSNTNIIGSKWEYRIKYNEDGLINRFKARFVARGFTQVPGLDYDETFSPVIKPTTIRIVLSLAVVSQWTIKQLDVKNAFLHCFLKETMYMEQPPCFVNLTFPNHVCLLNKSLYGLKQAPHAWFERYLILFLPLVSLAAKQILPYLFIKISMT